MHWYFFIPIILLTMNATRIQIPVPQNDQVQVKVLPFKPGRFAHAIQVNKLSGHAAQLVRETTTSSFVLDLQPNGTTTLCRGWRYIFTNDGALGNNSGDHIEEQLSYQGTWQQEGAWIQVELARTPSKGCEEIGKYTNLVPKHADHWRLSCIPVEVSSPDNPPTPLLVCKLDQYQNLFGEGAPHSMENQQFQGEWIVLGAGNGVRLKVVDNQFPEQAPVEFSAVGAEQEIGVGAWRESF